MGPWDRGSHGVMVTHFGHLDILSIRATVQVTFFWFFYVSNVLGCLGSRTWFHLLSLWSDVMQPQSPEIYRLWYITSRQRLGDVGDTEKQHIVWEFGILERVGEHHIGNSKWHWSARLTWLGLAWGGDSVSLASLVVFMDDTGLDLRRSRVSSDGR